MEKKLVDLFEHQHFQQNRKLNSVIQDVEGRYARALDDGDLDLVYAAGEGQLLPEKQADIPLAGETSDKLTICLQLTQQDER